MKTIHNSGVDVLAGGTLTRVALLNTALTFSVFIRGEWGWGGDREEHLSTFDPIHHTIQKRTQNENDRRRQVVFLDATRVVCMSASECTNACVVYVKEREDNSDIWRIECVWRAEQCFVCVHTLHTHTHTDTLQSNRVFNGLFLSIKHTHTHNHHYANERRIFLLLAFQLTHKFRTRRIFRTVRRICFRSLSIRGFLWSLLTKLNYPFIQFLAGERRFIRICLTLCLRYWSVSVEHSDYTHT